MAVLARWKSLRDKVLSLPVFRDEDKVKSDDCAYSLVGYEDLKPADTLTFYGLLRDYVKHEDNLINIRQTWSLGIHAFLLSTYGLLFTRGVDLLLKLPDLSEGAAKRFETIVSLLLAAQALIAFVGFYVGYSSRKAIHAAHLAIIHLSCMAHEIPQSHVPIEEKRKPDSKKPDSTQPDSTQPDSTPPGSTPPGSTPPDKVWLLPRIVGGGTKGGNTMAARKYYLHLPLLLTVFWVILFAGSGFVAYWSFTHQDRFYSDFSKPNKSSPTANSSVKN